MDKYMEQNEELYRAWIGTKNQDKYFQKMQKGGFSFASFFISDLLFITRKMYVESIVLILAVYVINIILRFIGVPNIGYNIASIVIALIMGFTYYPLYRWNIKRKIEKYKRKGLTYEEQLEVAKKYGGDKITFAVVGMIFVDIMIVIALYMITTFILTALYYTDLQVLKNEENVTNDYNENTYLDDYNGNPNNSETKTWNVANLKLNYDTNYWKETVEGGIKLLKYNDKNASIVYLKNQNISDGIETLNDYNNKKKFEDSFKNEIEKEDGTKLLESDWEKISGNMYKFYAKCSVEKDNTYGYTHFYYYFTKDKMYSFMAVEYEYVIRFNYYAGKVLDTIKDNF